MWYCSVMKSWVLQQGGTSIHGARPTAKISLQNLNFIHFANFFALVYVNHMIICCWYGLSCLNICKGRREVWEGAVWDGLLDREDERGSYRIIYHKSTTTVSLPVFLCWSPRSKDNQNKTKENKYWVILLWIWQRIYPSIRSPSYSLASKAMSNNVWEESILN